MSQTRTEEGASTSTVTVEEEKVGDEELTLRLSTQAPPSGPRVTWTTNTVDNEGMGKRKSKCCCIYKKKRKWDEDESSDDSDCETGNCKGHVEKRKEHDHNEDGREGHCHS